MTKQIRKELITVAILFAVLIGVSFIPAKGILRFIIHLPVYALAGLDIFNRLIRSLSKKRIFTEYMMLTVASVLAMVAGRYAESITALLLFRLYGVFCDFVKYEAEKNIGRQQNSDRRNIERYITRFSKILAPIVFAVALFVIAIGISVSPSNWRDDIIKGAIIIAVAYPSAVAVSVPFAFFVGIGLAHKSGINVKSSYSVERLSKCSTVVFDKAGTLTEEGIHAHAEAQTVNSENLLTLASTVLAGSQTPEAIAVRGAAKGVMYDIPVSNAKDVEGLGTVASMSGKIVAVGNSELMAKLGITVSKANSDTSKLLHLCLGQTYLGYIEISDTIREDADRSLYRLKNVGVKSVVMLTRDGVGEATRVADTLHGIDEFYHSLNGEGMAKVIEEIFEESAENETLAFVTSNTENASVLASADISITLNKIDSEDTDIVLEDSSIDKIPLAIGIAQKVMLNVRLNIGISLTVKLIVAILGIIGIIGLNTAVFIDLTIACLAAVNAIRPLFRGQ